ncbi:ATP-dependent DNA helicase RecG [Holospora obtusa F1]|uniref:ATP-dependent DNA helicase RecG n=1 Tax=Holospora obtusa F1 TaxID=1399147 RepID=W6TDR8_HOLOB|nr:DEAD/DEAH box helicase [Holospora obtusa]ETZ06921.1 ATP-dependent DNA helicase RecG [Holospora obtusa F1]
MTLEALAFFSQKLSALKGIGTVWTERLESLGLKTFWDILAYVPCGYETCASTIDPLNLPGLIRLGVQIKSLEDRVPYKVHCTIIVPFFKKNSDYHVLNLDERTLPYQEEELSQKKNQNLCKKSEQLMLVFFKKPLYPLIINKSYTAEGVLERSGEGYVIKHPKLFKYCVENKREYRAIYPLKYGITSAFLRSVLQRIFLIYPHIKDWIPEIYGMPSQKEAFRCIHFPLEDPKNINQSMAFKRLVLDELLAQQLGLKELKIGYAHRKSLVCFGNSEILDNVLRRFNRALTSSQCEAWSKIQQELLEQHPMMRLLHGDVGSGKSIVAFLMLVQIATSGHQGGILVPTEVLAHQHANALKKLLEGTGLEVALWTGSSKKRLKGDVIVGTHALFQEHASFDALAGIVVDEQHKFGVLQRLDFVRKGKNLPHTLFMSATPIPRTLEMTLWGQISVSRLEKRSEQLPVTTYMMSWNKISELYLLIQRCLDRKEAVYWVCPWIEKEDEENFGKVIFRHQDLLAHFPNQVGMLHGKLPWSEKEAVLRAFAEKELGVLVSTTAIEVGVHVDHASTMIIEESQRFGLAQLHQLRGRVGRSLVKGQCFLIWGKTTSSLGFERLKLLKRCHDGFVLAQEDLRLRGAGSLCGLRQSGNSEYYFANLSEHQHLLELAIQLSETLKSQNEESVSLLLKLFGYHHLDLWNAG